MALGNANCLLSWPNYALPQYAPRTDGVVQILTPLVSGGGWQPTMPVTNLGNDKYYQPARSIDCNPANTQFIVDHKTSRPARVFALIRHNFSPIKGGDANAPTVRVTHSDDPTFAAYSYRSAFVPVFSAMYAPGSLPSGWNPAWFTGGPTIEDLLAYASLTFVHVADQNYVGRYTRYEVVDTANGNGFIQIGDYHTGPAYQPRINMNYGAKIGAEDSSTAAEGDTGVEFWTRKRVRRIAEFSLDVQSDEALGLPFELQMRQGISRKLLFVMDPGSPYHMHRLSFPARLRQLSPLENPYFDRFTVPIQLREAL